METLHQGLINKRHNSYYHFDWLQRGKGSPVEKGQSFPQVTLGQLDVHGRNGMDLCPHVTALAKMN